MASQYNSSLRDYIGVVSRRKVAVVVIAVLVPAMGLAYSLSQTPVYQATAAVLLTQENLTSSGTVGSAPPPLEDPDRFAVTQARLARTGAVLRSTLRTTNVAESIAQLRANSSVSAAPDSDFLEFSVNSTSAYRAALLATTYAREFTRYRSQLDTATLHRAVVDVGARLQQLERAHEERSQLYSSLLSQQQHLSTLELLQSPRAVLADRASGTTKVQPRPVRNTFVAAGFGVVLALVVAFLLEALDTRIYSAAELADALGLRVLGTIPPLPRKALGRKPRRRALRSRAMPIDPSGTQAEAFRELRLNFEGTHSGAQLVMVTSAHSGEGKSLTAANLAMACARAGRYVLLVDADLRGPELHKFFGVGIGPGLTEVMLSRTALDHAIVQVPLLAPNDGFSGESEQGFAHGVLELLPAGLVPPDPGSFLEMTGLAALLTKLSSLYELVFIDTPPLLEAADGIALGSRVDALLVVARANKTRRHEVRKLRRALDTIPIPKLGVVIMGAEVHGDYGYVGVSAVSRAAGESVQFEARRVPIEHGGVSSAMRRSGSLTAND